MEVTSRDGNMVVDFYPVKDMNNNLIANRMLKVLSFRGDTQKKMIISRQEFYYQVREYIKDCKYKVTSEYMPAQFINQEVESCIVQKHSAESFGLMMIMNSNHAHYV